MATAVVREAFKQSLRASKKIAAPFQGSENVFATDRCPRRVFSCTSLDCPHRTLCSRWRPQVRLYPQNVLRVAVAKHHGSECITHQECWKCGSTINPNTEQYFCECGVVQPPIEKRSLFQVMGLEEKFDIDLKMLAEKYRGLQRILHPDKYSQKSETEKEFSIQHSALVNKAYNTLLRPLSRGLYLLRLKEEDLEKETQMDLEFLDKIMEFNEAIIEADSVEAIQALEQKNQEIVDNLVAGISKAFKENDKALAKTLLVQLKYYANIEDKIKGFKIQYAG